MRISTAARDAGANAIADLMETGAGTSKLQLRTGSAPASISDPAAGTLLGEFDLPDPAFGNSATGVVTLNGVPIAETGLADGTIGHGRFLNQNGDAVADTNSVGTSGTEIVVDTTTVSTGLPLSLVSATWTMPAGTP